MHCQKCGEVAVRELVAEYQNQILGVPAVLINCVEVQRCKCGEIDNVTIPDPNGLTAAVAVSLAKHPFKLNGIEIRFMRKALGMNVKELARILSVREETISRWENNKEPIGPANEKLLRLFVGKKLEEAAPAIDFDSTLVATMELNPLRSNHAPLRFMRMQMKKQLEKKKLPVWDEAA